MRVGDVGIQSLNAIYDAPGHPQVSAIHCLDCKPHWDRLPRRDVPGNFGRENWLWSCKLYLLPLLAVCTFFHASPATFPSCNVYPLASSICYLPILQCVSSYKLYMLTSHLAMCIFLYATSATFKSCNLHLLAWNICYLQILQYASSYMEHLLPSCNVYLLC